MPALPRIPPAGVDHIEIKLDIPFLEQRPELVLVDFPGSDSNLEAHNKAIASYLDRGGAFILLVPAINGGISESDRQFVREAMRYPQGLGCIVSKADLVSEEQCKKVAVYVARQIRDIYGGDAPAEYTFDGIFNHPGLCQLRAALQSGILPPACAVCRFL